VTTTLLFLEIKSRFNTVISLAVKGEHCGIEMLSRVAAPKGVDADGAGCIKYIKLLPRTGCKMNDSCLKYVTSLGRTRHHAHVPNDQ